MGFKGFIRDELSMFFTVTACLIGLLLFPLEYKAPIVISLLFLAFVHKAWRRKKQSRMERANRIAIVVRGRLNELEDKLSDNSITSIHFINASSQFLFNPQELWQKYHERERFVFRNKLSKVKQKFAHLIEVIG